MPALISSASGSPVLLSSASSPSISASIASPPFSLVSSSPASTIHSNINIKYDVNATALSVDATGSYAVLAARKGLYLIDLEAPYVPAYTLHHQTKWEVSVVKCNPHVLFKGHVASTSNHNTLIWNINASGNLMNAQGKTSTHSQPLIATLRAHTRPVSDLSWSPSEPTIVATCSADTKTHLWDIRTPQRPVQTLCAFTSSATQVEWNRVDQTSIATAHDGEVRIWDTRAVEKAPAVMITAHMQKIYGIDWHPTRVYDLVTCSEDKTVKLWNVTQPRVCQGTLTTGAPVWRARYTPFGDGLVTISHRLDNTLRLWALSYSESSGIGVDQVHAFSGHNDLVKAFVWRSRPQAGVFQLVSWSKSQELRMWRVDPQHLEACGYDSTYTETSVIEPTESLRTDSFQLQRASKYDLSYLKNDFLPLVVPKTAVPLQASEYSFSNHDKTLQKLLEFEEERVKIPTISPSQITPSPSKQTRKLSESSNSSALLGQGMDRSSVSSAGSLSASSLPCPRISGACFSGPNMLIVFDSRVAIGQTRNSAPTNAAPVGTSMIRSSQSSKAETGLPSVQKPPRTYEELLDLKDSRFATKKKKKPLKMLPTATDLIGLGVGVGGTGADGWGAETVDGAYEDGDSVHGFIGSRSFYKNSGLGDLDGGGADMSVHGGSEYLKAYFSNSEYHLPVNHPDHRISVQLPPNPAPAGAPLTPRSTRILTTTERGNRVDQTSSLNLELSLSVTILDLSRLCGVSSLLTYETQIAVSPCTTHESYAPLRFHPSAIQQALMGSKAPPCTLSRVCAHNARVASAAGRNDLQQIWSLLELSTASNPTPSLFSSDKKSHCLVTDHPWSAHPFGKSLVDKILKMYEKVGDLPTLANIVCVLEQHSTVEQPIIDGMQRNSDLTDAFVLGKAHVERSNSQASLTGDTGAAPSSMKNPRRSSSCNQMDRYAGVERPSQDINSKRLEGPKQPNTSENRLSVTTYPSGNPSTPSASSSLRSTPKGSMNHLVSSWKMDFEKIENPFRTWSAGSRESSPRPSTKDIFQRTSSLSESSDETTNDNHESSAISRGLTEKELLAEDDARPLDTRLAVTVRRHDIDQDTYLLSTQEEEIERYDTYKACYGDLLYRYGAMNVRSDVLKLLSHDETPHEGISFALLCHACQNPCDGLFCSSCRDFSIKCSLCQLVVRGQSMFCVNCGHGGHEQHMREWFETENACPTGCGCWCKQATGTLSPYSQETGRELGHPRSYSF